jgi:thiol-disulfide isomerase/thioredoxin
MEPDFTPRRRAALPLWLIATGVAVVAGAAGFGVQQWLEARAHARHDAEAAIFAIKLTDADDAPHSLDEFRGRVLVVNFWATWCGPCLAEMPDLQKVQDEYGARGVDVVGIAIDRPDAVREFRRANAIRYPLLIGGAGGAALARQLGDGEGALPYTAIFDKSGAIVEQHLGQLDPTQLRGWLDARLRS